MGKAFKKSNPYINDEDEFIFEKSKIKVGIIYTTFYLQYHKYWISASTRPKYIL